MKKASKKEMRDALELVARWLGSDDATATFEDIGEWFYKETGLLRPGKSMPAEMPSDDENRAQAFKDWASAMNEHVRATVKAALR